MLREPISMMTWFLGVAGTLLLFAIILPLLGPPVSGGAITHRQANLRTLATMIHGYASDHNGGIYAERDEFFAVLSTFTSVYPEPIFGDENQDDMWMVPIPWPDRRIPENITPRELAKLPMLHERVGLNPDGTSVAFWDGSVRLLSNEEFERLVDAGDSVCLGCKLPIPDYMKHQEP